MELPKNQVKRKVSDALLAWVNLGRIERALQGKLASFYEKFNLTQSQFEVLSLLWVNPDGLSQKEITERLQWSKGTNLVIFCNFIK